MYTRQSLKEIDDENFRLIEVLKDFTAEYAELVRA